MLAQAALQVEQKQTVTIEKREGQQERDTIDAVYGAIYDDSTFLFQPQWDRRNLNLLHILYVCLGRGREEIKTKHLRGGKNNAKTAENVSRKKARGER